MAHGSEDRELERLHAKRHRSDRAPTTGSSRDTVRLIACWSFEQTDSEEFGLRVAVEQAGDFAWNRLQLDGCSQGAMPIASEIEALRPAAVIVLLSTADTAVVRPLFARLRLDDPERPI